MPRYDFRCPNGHTTRGLAHFTDPCPPCEICGEPTKRQIGAPMFVFGQGASLTDVHDIEIQKMEARGELDRFK